MSKNNLAGAFEAINTIKRGVKGKSSVILSADEDRLAVTITAYLGNKQVALSWSNTITAIQHMSPMFEEAWIDRMVLEFNEYYRKQGEQQ